ncbi:MAG: hypothetical protein COA42_23255 [Alteromonadaceae bacterium]|nr:MAG: hypothetical protein COA42_23255 [Alteromonadaceae bacterium]
MPAAASVSANYAYLQNLGKAKINQETVNMNQKIKISLALMAIVPQLALGWAGERKVTHLQISDFTGIIYFKTDSTFSNPATCTSTDMYAIRSDSNLRTEIYSSLLAAQLSGKKINIEIDPTNCVNNRPVLKRVEILSN